MSKMKDQAIVCNIGHSDNEIQVAELEKMPGVKKEIIKEDHVQVGLSAGLHLLMAEVFIFWKVV